VFLSCAPLSPCSAAVAPRRCKEFVDYKDSVRKTCEVRLLKPSIETTRPEGLLWRSKQSSTLALQRAELFCTAQIRQQAPNGFGRPEIRIEWSGRPTLEAKFLQLTKPSEYRISAAWMLPKVCNWSSLPRYPQLPLSSFVSQ